MPPISDYAIAQPETIGLRVPAHVLVSRAVLDAVNTLEVQRTLVPRAAMLSGPVVSRGAEVLLRSASEDVFLLVHFRRASAVQARNTEFSLRGRRLLFFTGFH